MKMTDGCVLWGEILHHRQKSFFCPSHQVKLTFNIAIRDTTITLLTADTYHHSAVHTSPRIDCWKPGLDVRGPAAYLEGTTGIHPPFQACVIEETKKEHTHHEDSILPLSNYNSQPQELTSLQHPSRQKAQCHRLALVEVLNFPCSHLDAEKMVLNFPCSHLGAEKRICNEQEKTPLT